MPGALVPLSLCSVFSDICIYQSVSLMAVEVSATSFL